MREVSWPTCTWHAADRSNWRADHAAWNWQSPGRHSERFQRLDNAHVHLEVWRAAARVEMHRWRWVVKQGMGAGWQTHLSAGRHSRPADLSIGKGPLGRAAGRCVVRQGRVAGHDKGGHRQLHLQWLDQPHALASAKPFAVHKLPLIGQVILELVSNSEWGVLKKRRGRRRRRGGGVECVRVSCVQTNLHGPDAELAVGVAREEELAIGRPRERSDWMGMARLQTGEERVGGG